MTRKGRAPPAPSVGGIVGIGDGAAGVFFLRVVWVRNGSRYFLLEDAAGKMGSPS
jgi:hypothetical protein